MGDACWHWRQIPVMINIYWDFTTVCVKLRKSLIYRFAAEISHLCRRVKTSEVASLTILGTVERDLLCCRLGARTGDIVFVTGALGNSYGSGRHLTFEPRLTEGRF